MRALKTKAAPFLGLEAPSIYALAPFSLLAIFGGFFVYTELVEVFRVNPISHLTYMMLVHYMFYFLIFC